MEQKGIKEAGADSPVIEVGYSRRSRSWVARLTGLHPKYNFDRVFLNALEKTRSCSGKTGRNKYILDKPGIYEIANPYNGREYIRVTESGETTKLTAEEAYALLAED